jgi:hypothetical protein
MIIIVIINNNINIAFIRLPYRFLDHAFTKNSTDTSKHANRRKLAYKQVLIKLNMRTWNRINTS